MPQNVVSPESFKNNKGAEKGDLSKPAVKEIQTILGLPSIDPDMIPIIAKLNPNKVEVDTGLTYGKRKVVELIKALPEEKRKQVIKLAQEIF